MTRGVSGVKQMMGRDSKLPAAAIIFEKSLHHFIRDSLLHSTYSNGEIEALTHQKQNYRWGITINDTNNK